VIKEDVIKRLKDICGEASVFTENSDVKPYLYDETELDVRPQACEECVVVRPGSDKEISEILKLANETMTPVVPRGGGTGACGAAIPTQPSIILAMERFRKILDIDKNGLLITVEAGVTLAKLNETLAKETPNLYFPCHPGDEGAQAGGLAIENAGGARAVKFGIMRNYIKGMKVVFPNGEIAQLGGKLMKNNMGYDLLHMCIGSEGTLCVVTEVTLKLQPKQGCYGTMVASFMNPQDAVNAVGEVMNAGIVPLGVEYMDREVALTTAKELEKSWPMNDEGKIDIIFMLEESDDDALYDFVEKISEICEKHNSVGEIIAESSQQQRDILEIRSEMYEVYKTYFLDSLDTAVPVEHVGDLLTEIDRIAAKYHTTSPRVGHVADGNFHNFIMKNPDGSIPEWVDKIRKEYYLAALKYGGTITAEHGTGKTRKKYMELQFSPEIIDLMKRIKKAFDPNNILNPGVIVDL
jgi:glycolate oxidase